MQHMNLIAIRKRVIDKMADWEAIDKIVVDIGLLNESDQLEIFEILKDKLIGESD